MGINLNFFRVLNLKHFFYKLNLKHFSIPIIVLTVYHQHSLQQNQERKREGFQNA